MDELAEMNSKLSEKEDNATEAVIPPSSPVIVTSVKDGESNAVKEAAVADPEIDSHNESVLELVTDASPNLTGQSRHDRKLEAGSRVSEITKVDSKNEDLTLPQKRPRTTALSRSYSKEKDLPKVSKENGKVSEAPPTSDAEGEKVDCNQPSTEKTIEADNNIHSKSLKEVTVSDTEIVAKGKVETPLEVTRSRYGRIRKKRPVSPITPEATLPKEMKIASKNVTEASSLPTASTVTEDHLIPWEVGDIVWARLSGYPWWPGLIGEDPLLKVYTKIQARGHDKNFRMYHVQFLGSAVLRGWLSAKSLMPYEGKAKYEEHKKKVYDSAPSKAKIKSKMLSAFEVKPTHKAAWLESIEEAEEALPLDREERQLKHGVDYFTDSSEDERRRSKSRGSSRQRRSSTTSTTKRERRSSKASEATSDKVPLSDASDEEPSIKVETKKSPPSQKRSPHKETKKRNSKPKETTRVSPKKKTPTKNKDDDDDNSDEDFEVKSSPKKMKTAAQPNRLKVIKGNFDLFLRKHKEEVKKEHPDQPDESIENFLRKQWEIMTDAQRARYRSHFGSRQEVGKSKSPSSSRNRSPSKSKSPSSSRNRSPSKSPNKPTEKVKEIESVVAQPSPSTERRQSKIQSTSKKKASPSNVSPRRTARESKTSVESRVAESDSQDPPEAEDFAVEIVPSPTVSEVLSEASVLEGVAQTPTSSGSQRNNGEVRVERICLVCEKPSELANDLVKCEGMCCAFFHVKCAGVSNLSSDGFKCEECTTGIRTCFACKTKASDLRRCTVAHCGRFYHEHCLQKNYLSRMEGKSIVCPLHVCVSCAASNPKNPWANKGRLYRCIRCPTAYHATDLCMGAGSAILSQGTMVCPCHYKLNQKHLNVNWCFLCSVGGSLLCCESCPASFHVECLEIEPPEGSYFCADCVLGQQPKFGDIVWVKLGCYRWWPAEIQNPKAVPDNIQSIEHKNGEFPVFFFGSHDYYWTNRSRVYQYQEGDRGTKDGTSKGIAKVFEAALQEAAEAYKALKEVRESRDAQEQERINQRPPPYRLIKNNKPVGKVQLYTSDHLEQNPCECDPNGVAPCNSDTECLNRMLMIECDPAVCAAGEQCCNQRFQKRQYVATLPIKTEGKGWGLKTLVDITKGDFVIEYVGEVIDEEECRQRMAKMHEQQCTDFYFLTIDKDRIIDAGPKGNPARYMNHSCHPNCETQKWTVNGDTRVGLFAIDNVPAGTELTFNYNLDCLGNEKSQCCCGASNCSGYIGDRPKVTNPSSLDKKAREASLKKRKKRRTVRYDKREHEDECFRCGEGGELVMCDKKSCSKAYHLSCLSLNKPPHGRWECPWHHCDVCGRPSVLLCAQCPNSFCQDHHEDLITIKVGGYLLCYDHGSQPSENAAKLLQLRSTAFHSLSAKSWSGKLILADSEQSTPTRGNSSAVGDSDDASSSKRRRRSSAKDLLPGFSNGCADQSKEEYADEAVVRRSRSRPRKGSLVENENAPFVNGGVAKDVLQLTPTAFAASEPDKQVSSPGKKNARASHKDLSLKPVNGNASPLKKSKVTARSLSPSLASDDEDDTDFESTSKRANLLIKPKRKLSPPKPHAGKNSSRVTPQRYSSSRARQPKNSVNGSVATTGTRNRKSAERNQQRTKRRDVVVVEERMAVLNENLTVDCIQPEVVTIKEEMDDTTAIITVENLSGVGALDLKPYVQKYKLENGELSLEECEDSEIEMVEAS